MHADRCDLPCRVGVVALGVGGDGMLSLTPRDLRTLAVMALYLVPVLHVLVPSLPAILERIFG